MKLFKFLFIAIFVLESCSENSISIKAENLRESASKAMESNEFLSALNFAKDALKNYTSIQDTLGIIESNYLIARASALSGDFNNAVLYGKKGSHLCEIIKNYPLEYKLNNVLSWSYSELGKGFDETFDHQKRQLYVVEQLKDADAKAMVYNNYGYDATVLGSIPLSKAIEYTKIANQHYAKKEKNNGLWYTLMNLSWQYRLMNDLNTSEKYGRMAVEQAQADNDRHAIIEANTNLGETLLAQNKIEEAEVFYTSGLELSKQKNDRDKFVFEVYYSRFLWEIGEYDAAISSLKASVDFLKTNEIFYEMLARAFLAEFYYDTGNTIEAQKQIDAFKNPRATYFSQEADVLASLVEAKINANTNKEMALNLLDEKAKNIDQSGAIYLKLKLLTLKKNIMEIFTPVIPIIKKGLLKSKSNHIIDLGSGGGGGLIELNKRLIKDHPNLKITLTDYYPNIPAFEFTKKKANNFNYLKTPIDARSVPKELIGLRTQFLSLHHFKPEEAKKILQNAIDSKSSIAVFEAQERSIPSILAMLFSPISVLLTTPLIKPFKIGRIVFTYLIPIVPLFVLWDGLVSAFRTYSVKEMKALVKSLEGNEFYDWDIDRLKSGPGVILYLLGTKK